MSTSAVASWKSVTRWVMLLIGLAALAACGPAGQPAIELEQNEIDLGRVTNGEVRTFTVEVRNTGQATLEIEAVTTSCGCTSAAVAPLEIGPGQTGMLEVTYDSGAHGPEFAGQVTRQVFVASNDPDEREVVFELHSDVVLP